MATAKKNTTKTTAKKSTKAADTKSTAKATDNAKASAKRDSSGAVTDKAKDYINQANDQVGATVDQVADRVEAVMSDVVKFGKQAGFTTVGVPFALQSKYEAGTLVDFETYKSFPDDAKVAGEEQVAEFQKRVEPYMKQFSDRIEPMMSKFEESLPEAARKPVQQGRERVNRVVNA